MFGIMKLRRCCGIGLARVTLEGTGLPIHKRRVIPKVNRLVYDRILEHGAFDTEAVRLEHPIKPRRKTFYMDIAVLPVKLNIEVDGKEHRTKNGRQRDNYRDKLLWRIGWRVLRLRKREVINNLESCWEIIRDELSSQVYSPQPYA